MVLDGVAGVQHDAKAIRFFARGYRGVGAHEATDREAWGGGGGRSNGNAPGTCFLLEGSKGGKTEKG